MQNSTDQYQNCFEDSLPEYFITGAGQQYLPYIQRAITELSQLTAWTWTSLTVTRNWQKEEELKEYYSSLLQNLAMQTAAFEHYHQTDEKEKAIQSSQNLKKLLLGEDTDDWSGMTLNHVIQSLSKYEKSFVFTEKKDFTNKLIFLASISLDAGTIADIPGNECLPDEEKMFLVRLCLPPRPALSEYTITEKQLSDWAQQRNTGGSYLPPAFLPLAAS